MKRLAIFLMLMAMVLAMAIPAYAEDNVIKVIINGEELKMETLPVLIKDRTMVPMRRIFEALGAYVEWFPAQRKVLAYNYISSEVLELTIDDVKYLPRAAANFPAKTFDVAPVIVDGRTLVPVRLVAEFMGMNVEWQAATTTVVITGRVFTGDAATPPPLYTNYAFRYKDPEAFAIQQKARDAQVARYMAWQEALWKYERTSGPISIAVKDVQVGSSLGSMQPGNGSFVLIKVSIKNGGSDTKHVNPLHFTLATSKGISVPVADIAFRYTDTLKATDLPPNCLAEGYLVFDIKHDTTYKLYFNAPGAKAIKDVPIAP